MTDEDQRLEVSRVIRADRERVFSAWTEPTQIVHWWGAGGLTCPEAELDLSVGGTYRIANAGTDGSVLWITGAFSHVEPPRRLTYSWAAEPVSDQSEHTVVDVTFSEVAEGTLVTILHTMFASTQSRDMHLGGWSGCFDGLEALLTG